MNSLRFEDLVKNEGQWMRAPQAVFMKMGVVKSRSEDKEILREAQALYKAAYENRKRVSELLKQAEELCEKAKEEVLNLIGNKDFEDESMSLKLVERSGSVDKKLLVALYPKVDLEKVSNGKSYYWKVQWKETHE